MAINLQLNSVAKKLTPAEIARATAVATKTSAPVYGPPAPVKQPLGPVYTPPPKPTPAPNLTIGNVASKLPAYTPPPAGSVDINRALQSGGLTPVAPPKPPTTFEVGAGLTPEQKARAEAVVKGNQIIDTPQGTKTVPIIPVPETNHTILQKAGDLAKTAYQVPARAAASVLTKGDLQPTTPAERAFFGDEKITPIADRVAQNEQTLKDMGVKHGALPLAFAGVVGSTTLDLFPGSAEEKSIASKLVKNPEDMQIMRDFIDNVRLKGPVNHELELDATRIAEGYGMKMPKNTSGLANEFDKHLANIHTAVGPRFTPSQALENNPEAGFARLPGVETDPVLQKQFAEINKNLQAAKSGSGGQVVRDFKGAQFDLSPDQTQNLAKIQDTLGLGQRNVRTFEDMTTLATELGTDPKTLLKNTHGGQISDAEVAGISQLIKTNTDFVSSASKELATVGTTSEKALLEAKINAAEEQIKTGLTKLRIGNTENGRAIVANRILAKNTLEPVFWYRKAEKQLASHGAQFSPEIRAAIDDLIAKKDRTGLSMFMASLDTATNSEKAITLWKAGLLTSPTTHLANIAGNATMVAAENISDVIATTLDSFVSIFTGKRTKSFSLQGVGQQAKGAWTGIKKAPEILAQGRDLETAMNKLDIPKNVEFKNPILSRYTKTVFGALAAEDKVFKETALRGALYEQARVQALNEGLTGTQFKARVKQLFEAPTDEMVAEAINVAEYRTFNNQNAASKAFTRVKGALGPAGKAGVDIAVPFVKTPTNVAKVGLIDYTPAGIVKTLIQQINPATRSQKALVEGLARGLTGSSVIALGGVLAAQGLMTGNAPTSTTEQAQWDLEGKQAHSVKIAGKWVNLDKISPVGNLLTLGAEVFNYHTSDGASLPGEVVHAGFAGLKGISQQSFVQGLSRASAAIADPQRNAESYLSSTIGGVIPTVVTRAGQVFDPVVRKPQGIWQTIESKVPGLMGRVAPKRDALGNVMTRDGLGRIIDPFSSTTQSKDPVVMELKKLDEGQGVIGTPDTSFKSLKVSGQEKDKYLQMVGQITRDTLAKGIKSDVYKKLSPSDKRDAIQKSVSNIRSTVRAQFIAAQMAKELNAASTKAEQAAIWEQYDKDGTMTKAAQNELRQLIDQGKVKPK